VSACGSRRRATSLPEVPATTILITRPEPGASRTAALLAEMGLAAILGPCLEIRPLPARLPPPAQVQAVLLTSANAVPALSEAWHDRPVFAVGAATAAQARAAGCTDVHSADANAQALAALVTARLHPSAGPLLLLSGRGQGLALAAILRSHGFRVVRRAVYAAVPPAALPAPVVAALRAGEIHAALFFSAETARAFLRLAERAGMLAGLRQAEAIAISNPTRMALEAGPWRRIRVAAQPTQDAMLACLR
jgi:uroporphyrinogen-III synthase